MTKYSLFLLLVILIAGCKTPPVYHYSSSGDFIIAEGGNILWYNQPSGVHYSEGKHSRTYIAWTDSTFNINICYYDDDTNEVSPPVKVHKWGFMDDHGQPVVHVKKYGVKKGHILLFFALHNSPMLFRRSSAEEDISSFTSLATIDEGDCGYPSVIENPSGELMLFYNKNVYDKENTWTRPLYSRGSTDGGDTWSTEIELVNSGRGTWVYYVAPASRKDTIHLTYSIRDSVSNLVRHVCYIKSTDWGKTWGSSDSLSDKLPVKYIDNIYITANGYQTRAWDIKTDASGAPVIAYIVYDTLTGRAYTTQRDSASKWISTHVADSKHDYYPAGIVIDEKNTNIVYCGQSSGNSNVRIVEKTFDLNTTSYVETQTVSQDIIRPQVRPQIIRNYNNLKLLWVDVTYYKSSWKYNTNLAALFLREKP